MPLKKNYSLNTKITFLFLLLGFVLLTILFIQIIPKMKEEQKKEKKHKIERMITLTNEQLKLAIELIIHSKKAKVTEIETQLKTYMDKNILKYKDSNQLLQNLNRKQGCKFTYLDKGLYKSPENQKRFIKDELVMYTGKQEHMCPKFTKEFIYTRSLTDGKSLVAQCSSDVFINKHNTLEEKIKKDLQKSFNLTYEDHKGKVNLIWINTKHKDYDSKPLYDIGDDTYNMKYCLSRISSSTIPQVGNLTAKQIIEASNKEPIYHQFSKNRPAYTWVKTLQDSDEVKLLYLTTIYEEDFNKNFTSPLLKILPATFFSLFTVIFLGVFLFKKLFKSINILTNTAKEVNNGNIEIRNNLRGNDDIAFLGKAFDNMLDSIKENIETLDKKVEEKTKQLSDSLQEKDMLLKEVHHRVKNNLAMTINLIKLQYRKIEDDKTKEILLNIQERIYTMELLHRKLYESKDLNSIPFKKYVNELCNDLDKTYKNSKQIDIKCEVDDINLSIEYALPCGLIITECLTNAYKYAFDKNSGKIKVIFKVEKEKCSLIISDNGVGLPQDVDLNKSKTLGIRLISSIIRGQLLGDFNYKYENGAKFYFYFNII